LFTKPALHAHHATISFSIGWQGKRLNFAPAWVVFNTLLPVAGVENLKGGRLDRRQHVPLEHGKSPLCAGHIRLAQRKAHRLQVMASLSIAKEQMAWSVLRSDILPKHGVGSASRSQIAGLHRILQSGEILSAWAG
jgi:hypothetical protein